MLFRSCQRYAGENDLVVILPPPLGHRRANRIFDYSNAKYRLRAHRYISDSLIVVTTVVHMHCLRSRLYSISLLFRSGTIFMESHKSAPLYLSQCQRYAGENDLGVILPPPLGHRRANRIFDYSNEKENNCMLFSFSYE